VVCEAIKTIDQDGGHDIVDIVSVNPDTLDVFNASGSVSEIDWTPIPLDKHGRPFSLQVRPVQPCPSWKFSKIAFDIKGAHMFRIRIGNVYIIHWVSKIFWPQFCKLTF